MVTPLTALIILLAIMLLAPIGGFLLRGLPARKREVLNSLTDDAIPVYFQIFHPDVPVPERTRARFGALYDKFSGSRNFVFPLLLLTLSIALALLFVRMAESIFVRFIDLPANDGTLSAVALSAALGAYSWVLYTFLAQYLRQSLAPRDLLWASFRFATTVPLSFALVAGLQSGLAVPTAFLMGAFPTHTLLRIARRFASKNLDFTEEDGQESELQRLQSLDREAAERLADLDIRTNLQLAYEDPVKLSIQSNFALPVIVDWVSQALLWIYLETDLEKVRKIGIRGAQEVDALWNELNQTNDGRSATKQRKTKKTAEDAVAAMAKALGMDEGGIKHTLGQVAEDPYTVFLYETWRAFPEVEEESDEQ